MISIPQHIKWAINSEEFGNYNNVPIETTANFSFSYENLYEGYDPSVNFKQAIRNRLTQLGNQKLAICISGIDSEIIAREAKDLGLSFELFFLSTWGMNDYMLMQCEQLSRELNSKLNVISVSREDAFHFSKIQYPKVRVNKPTYLILPMLFSAIPEDYYIICGEGDINKGDRDYQNPDIMIPDAGTIDIRNPNCITISNTEIVYWLWARENSRNGDYYFFSSTKELILSGWNDPHTEFRFPLVSNRESIKHYWGDNLVFKGKTTNWDTDLAGQENVLMRLENQAAYGLDKMTRGTTFCNVPITRSNEPS